MSTAKYICPNCKADTIFQSTTNMNNFLCTSCNTEFEKSKAIVEVNANGNATNGQRKCPACGASDITFDPNKGKLRCNYCGVEFEEKAEGFVENAKNLVGEVRGAGTSNIKADVKDVITLVCGGCGAEVVVDTKNAPHARCHWCRSILAINSQIENGSVPDVILPFKTTKQDAQVEINKFVKKRQFFAHPQFKKEFTTDNIIGVYFPYMLVDANCSAEFIGEGEHKTREYTRGSDDNRRTYYDADVYNVERKFDISIDDLTIESSKDRANKNSNEKTNNIINSLMPFDTENALKYEANYLVGYNSEKRDLNIEDLEQKVDKQLRTVTRFAIKKECEFYDRGIKWQTQNLQVKGKQWQAAYLPIWLYSYLEVKGNNKLLHYVAVNARTNETMGSVPINKARLFTISAIIEVISSIIGIFLFIVCSTDEDDATLFLAMCALGFIFYAWQYARYRNQNARHTFENETKTEITNLQSKDVKITERKKLSNKYIEGKNSDLIEEE